MTDVVVAPEWDLADRLVKARRHAGISRPALAEWMGVSRNSMSNYENGKTVPGLPVLRVWALRCGVDLDWLRYGDTAPLPQVVAGKAKRTKVAKSSTRWYSAARVLAGAAA